LGSQATTIVLDFKTAMADNDIVTPTINILVQPNLIPFESESS